MMQGRMESWLGKGLPLRSSLLVPAAVGFILFLAAVLKGVDPAAAESFHLAYVLAFEFLFAIWLWSGAWPAVSRLIALVLFSCFAVYNWTQATTGAVSCACFGAIGLSPWMAFGLDAAVVALLIYWQPAPGSVMTRAQLASGTVLFCLTAIIAVSGRDPKAGDGLLEVFPKVLDLGSVAQGTSGQAEFLLRNPSSEPVVISQLEISCPCLDIRLPGTAVPPGAELKGEAFLDMSKEPNFTGNLAIDFRGKTSEEKPAFGIVVLADIRNRH